MAQGKDLIEATLQAVHLRFRPILMTSIAFILGVLPLVVSSGAGSASQRAIGTGVMGGMITATRARDLLRAGVLRRRPPHLQEPGDARPPERRADAGARRRPRRGQGWRGHA